MKDKKFPFATGFLVCIFLAMAGILIYGIFFRPPTPAELEAYERDQFEAAATGLIKKNLKSPATADFAPSAEWAFDRINKNTWRMTGWVDSENSFSALLRDQFTVIVEHKNDDWQMKYLRFKNSEDAFGSYEFTPDEIATHEAESKAKRTAFVAEQKRYHDEVEAKRKADREAAEKAEAKRKSEEAAAFKRMHEQLDYVRTESRKQDDDRIAAQQERARTKAEQGAAAAAERQKIEDAKYHPWTSTAGEKICDGKIQSLAGQVLTVELKTGEKTKLDVSSLCDDDRKLVDQWRRAH